MATTMNRGQRISRNRGSPPLSALVPLLPRRAEKRVSFGVSTLGILTEDGRDAFEVTPSKDATLESAATGPYESKEQLVERDVSAWPSVAVKAPVFTLPSPLHPVSVREYLLRNGGEYGMADEHWPWSWSAMIRREKEELTRMMNELELVEEELEEFRAVLAGERLFGVDGSAAAVPPRIDDSAADIVLICSRMGPGAKLRRQGRPQRGGLSPYRSIIRMPDSSPSASQGDRHDVGQFGEERTAVNNENSLVLQAKLRRSFASMNNLYSAVKEDVLSIPRLCRAEMGQPQHFRVRAKLQIWGAERLLAMMEQVAESYKLAALRRWSRAAVLDRKAGKFKRYVKYQAVKKMELSELLRLRTNFALAWWTWADGARSQRLAEIRALRSSAATVIQCWRRAHVAWCLATQLRERKRTRAALMLQRRARGTFARVIVSEKRRELRMEGAAIAVQCLSRWHSARVVLLTRRRVRLENEAANRMQASVRGRIGRKIAAKRRYEKRKDGAAAELQRLVRGLIGRRLAAEWRETVTRNAAAIAAQKIGRIYLAKRRAACLREERERRLRVLQSTALVVQRVYRGHRGRLAVRLQMKARKSQIRKRNTAASRVQSFWRMVLAARLMERMRQDDKDVMMQMARQWQEMWSDESQNWFYYNAEANESLWEPPESGYTKADARLVLKNGHVVDDPLVPKESDDDGSKEDTKCVDCEKARASRLCDQCGDGFCTTCFIKAHPKGGRRERHTYVRLGPVECEECQAGVPAVRWCTSCDDPFCLDCWEVIHKTGNRAQHAYCRIDGENVSPRAWTADGSELAGVFPGGRYANATNPQDEMAGNPKTEQMIPMSYESYDQSQAQFETFLTNHTDTGSSWSTLYDANGIPYYVDSISGHSTYDSPWAATGVYDNAAWDPHQLPAGFGFDDSQHVYDTEQGQGGFVSPYQT